MRLLDGRASATLRQTYAAAAGRPRTIQELAREGAWIDSVAAPLRAFWRAHGERVLTELADDTGTEWVETSFNVYFIRQPVGVAAISLPIVIDLSPFERVPPERSAFYQGLLAWTLVHELVHRIYDQPAIARETAGPIALDPRSEMVAGDGHDWIDLVTAFVLHDVLGEASVRPLLYNRGLQRSIGVYRLDRFAERMLGRWQPSRGRPLREWLRTVPDVDTGFHHPPARARLQSALAEGGTPSGARVRAAVEGLQTEFGLGMEEAAQLLSDWESENGAGRLGAFPYRSLGGTWEWAR